MVYPTYLGKNHGNEGWHSYSPYLCYLQLACLWEQTATVQSNTKNSIHMVHHNSCMLIESNILHGNLDITGYN
jgi:hypothetical protein